jgi:hypothetical protein
VSHGLGLTIESLVAVLLALTIGYCMVLNRRLKRLRTDERALREMIAELVGATERAERSIGGLKLTVQECDQTLGERLRMAERLAAALQQQIETGERLLVGVSGATGVAAALQVRPPPPPPPPDTKAMVAAAQAFAERTRARTFGRAA